MGKHIKLKPNTHKSLLQQRHARKKRWRAAKHAKRQTVHSLTERVEVLEEILKEHGWLKDE